VVSAALVPVAIVFRYRQSRLGLVALVAALWFAGAGAASASVWKRQAIPRGIKQLFAVSCSSARACTAVGGFEDSSDPPVIRLSGTVWSIQRTAKPVASRGWLFNAVSCPSAADCMAVGASQTRSGRPAALTERWNGSSWQVLPVPTPMSRTRPSFLSDVSCTSPNACTAVGAWGRPAPGTETPRFGLIERWNGSMWSIQRAPKRSWLLSAVSCSSLRLCTAVGYDVLRWNRASLGGQQVVKDGDLRLGHGTLRAVMSSREILRRRRRLHGG
jgi:hypothetical protein